MVQNYLQSQPFTLAGSGSSISDQTLVLISMKDIDGTLITMTDVGVLGFGTIEPGSGTQEEAITFTGVTQNGNGTATLTGVKHQLFKYPYTQSAGMTKSHAGGTSFILSNTAGFYNYFDSNQNWKTPVNTFADLPSGNNAGECRVVLSPLSIYIWNGSAWGIFSASALTSAKTFLLGSQSTGADLKTFVSDTAFTNNTKVSVFRSGALQAEGANADYTTSGTTIIIFNYTVDSADLICLWVTL